MPARDEHLEQRLKEETAKIKVDSYQKTASLGGWAGGGRTLWAISVVGGAAGALVGLAAPLFPLLVGASLPGVQTILASVAAFAATGISMGFAGGTMLGRISGSVATVAEEQEKRMKQWTARQLLAQNPEANIVPDSEKTPEPKPTLRDTLETYINPRVGMAHAALGAVGGAIFAAAFLLTGISAMAIMPGLATLMGGEAVAANAAAVAAYTIGVCTSIGALWTFNFPRITSNVTQFFGELGSGKLVGREWKPQREQEQAPEIALPAYKAPEQEVARASFQDMVAKQVKSAEAVLTR